MRTLIRSEIQRVRTTRSVAGLLGLVVAYPVVVGLFVASSSEADRAGLDPGTIHAVVRGVGDVGMVIGAIVGVVLVAGAHQHRTIVPLLLVAPDRLRLATAQLATLAVVGALTALLAGVVAMTAGWWVLGANGVSVDLVDASLARTLSGVVAVVAAYTVLGGAVGALVRVPSAALAGVLIWMLVVEKLVPLVLRRPGIGTWLPGGAANGVLHAGSDLPHVLPVGAAAITLAAVVTALTAAATVAGIRRDVR